MSLSYSITIHYNEIVHESKEYITGYFYTFDIDRIPFWADTVWPQQKEYFDSVLLNVRLLKNMLEMNFDLVEDEIQNIENFIMNKLRSVIRTVPVKESEIQDGIENLFVGKGMRKGTDYDREAGVIRYSGRDYIPDFNMLGFSMCIEVKLVKESSHRSKVIEEINADITAYKTVYENTLFVVYDLGHIRDVQEFTKSIQNNIGVYIVVIKH